MLGETVTYTAADGTKVVGIVDYLTTDNRAFVSPTWLNGEPVDESVQDRAFVIKLSSLPADLRIVN